MVLLLLFIRKTATAANMTKNSQLSTKNFARVFRFVSRRATD